MAVKSQPKSQFTQLPSAYIDRLRTPITRFLHIETAGGAVLLLFTLAALILSNSALAHPFLDMWESELGLYLGEFEYARSLKEWINDGLMTLFFFLVALELKRELVLGELSKPRMAALSVMAALGGMLVPALVYLALQWGQPGIMGWGTVMATDTAFVIGCLALLGSRIPPSLRLFMLSLAIVDDIGAILVVAVGYSGELNWGLLALAAVGAVAIRTMASVGFRSFPLYFLVGVLVWLLVDASGIHATITGVVLGLMTPARRWVSDERLYAILNQVVAHPTEELGSGNTQHRQTLLTAEIAARETLSPVERLEMALHPWVVFIILPLFAFANAGLPLEFNQLDSSISVAVFFGFALGKPIGILMLSWMAVITGLATKPVDLSWRMLAGGGLLAGIGFTMALFIASLAFGPNQIDSAKLGILLASVVSAIAGIALLFPLPKKEQYNFIETAKVESS